MSPVWTPARSPPDRTRVSCPSHDALIVLRALREAHKRKREGMFKTEVNSKSSENYYATLYNKKFGAYKPTTTSSVSSDTIAERRNKDVKIKEEPIDYTDPCQHIMEDKIKRTNVAVPVPRMNSCMPTTSTTSIGSDLADAKANYFASTSTAELRNYFSLSTSGVPEIFEREYSSCVPTSGDPVTSGINYCWATGENPYMSGMSSHAPASPPLSISGDSDVESCDTSDVIKTKRNKFTSSNNYFVHQDVQRKRQTYSNRSNTLTKLSSANPYPNKHSISNTTPRITHQATSVLGYSGQERRVPSARQEPLTGLAEELIKDQAEITGARRDHSTGLTTSFSSADTMAKTINKKQKTSDCRKGFQVPVKRSRQYNQLTINKVFAQKQPSALNSCKDLIDVTMIDDTRRQQLTLQIKEAEIVALTLVYADSSTQLSAATTKKSKSAKLHSGDEKPVAVILVAMAKKEETKGNTFVRVPLCSRIIVVDKWIRKLFRGLMSDSSISKVCFGAQQMIHALLDLYSFDLRIVCSEWQVDDPQIAAWLLDADHCPHTFTELTASFNKQHPSSNSQGRYNVCDDLLCMVDVMGKLKTRLNEAKLLQLYLQVEVKICPILAVMETLGISVDAKLLLQYGKILQKKINAVEKEAIELMGYPFNINSNPQLRQVLFDELKLDEKYKQSNAKGLARTAVLQSKSTSESVLLKLKPYHDLPGLILEYRQLVKVNSTYIDGILEKVDGGMLHTSWDQTAASSGRLASANPNIQNIPKQVLMNGIKDKAVMEESVITIKPRVGFKAAVGKSLITADFQSIELRLLAHLSQDASLLAVFNNPGVTDVFVELTTHWLGIQKEKVTATDRDRTKRIVYSVFYGAGTERLSETLSVSPTQAKELRSSFLAKFPRVKQFTADCISRCCKQGFVETIFRRRRLLPNIKSSNFHHRSFAERQAVNFVVQGSAADLCKSAMIEVINKLASRPDLDAQLLVQIHDELLLESPDEEIGAVTGMLKSVMECTTRLCSSFTTLTVPILVSISVGKTWGDMVPYTGR